MNDLHQAINDYLQLRRSLGFKLKKEGHLLSDFARYLESHGSSFITIKLALEWATLPTNVSAKWRAGRLAMVRGLAKYVRAFDKRTEIPASNLISYQNVRPTPYLYSDDDIKHLMKVALLFRPPLRASTYNTLIGLLSVTGLRVGEAIGLDRQDIDCKQGLLYIRDTKFRKSRQIPLHQTTLEALQAYARMRDRIFPCPRNPMLFRLSGWHAPTL